MGDGLEILSKKFCVIVGNWKVSSDGLVRNLTHIKRPNETYRQPTRPSLPVHIKGFCRNVYEKALNIKLLEISPSDSCDFFVADRGGGR
jgi:hypothetical protein